MDARVWIVAALVVLPTVTAQSEQSVTWFLTGTEADFPELGVQGLSMAPELAGTNSQARFSSVGGLPIGGGSDAETVREVRWYSEEPWALDMEVAQDATLVLFFQASVQVSATASVDLRAVGPEGSATIASKTRVISVDSNSPSAFTFELAARGQVLPEDSVVELVVTVEGPSIATVVLYDSDANPSRLEGLRVGPLDSDGDGLPDSLERAAGTDPMDSDDPGDSAFDQDADGLPDTLEETLQTDPFDPDTDKDGWSDGAENVLGSDPRSATDMPADQDGDGLADDYEVRATTLKNEIDSDNDGQSDCLEDPDEDGLTHCDEQMYGTDPLDADSDGDGILDGDEVSQGTDPTLERFPEAPRVADVTEIIAASIMLATGLGLAVVGLARRHRL